MAATVRWNEYWSSHNAGYNARLESLQAKHRPSAIPSTELSEFYKRELADSRERHAEFNRWWLKENFALLLAGVKVRLRIDGVGADSEPGFFGGR